MVQRGDLSGVFVLADGRAALRWLRFGEAEEAIQLPVLAGLAPGERVQSPFRRASGTASGSERWLR